MPEALAKKLKAVGIAVPVAARSLSQGEHLDFANIMSIPTIKSLLDPILDQGAALFKGLGDDEHDRLRPKSKEIYEHIKAEMVAHSFWVSLMPCMLMTC